MCADFIKPAERVTVFGPYYFSILGEKIKGLQAQGLDVVRLDMGSPDLPPPAFIIDAMTEAAQSPNAHGYTAFGGIPKFREAVAAYYVNRFDVSLDPAKEIIALIGSKEGLFDLPIVLANEGDVILVPDPYYPVYKSGADLVGAEVHFVPLEAKNGFLPDLKAIPESVAKRAKIFWINYPNNPTGAVAPLKFFEEIVEFGRKYEIVIAHDAPYTEICYDGYVAPSILQVPGAKEVAVEFNSLSKAYNMGGWRLGMVSGNAKIVNLIHTYKSQTDTNQFGPIQIAGAKALTGDQTWLEERNNTYKERRDIILKTLRESGFEAETPPSTIYIWAKVPAHLGGEVEFCDRLLRETGVSLTPGSVYGEYGKGYVRVSLGIATGRCREAMERLRDWVNKQ
jgi:LL-diaminopimelate aminotransferase